MEVEIETRFLVDFAGEVLSGQLLFKGKFAFDIGQTTRCMLRESEMTSNFY